MPALDFVVAGFPKCGTTTLLYALRSPSASTNILMSSREVCAVKDRRRPELTVQERYRRELSTAWGASSSSFDRQHRRRGIKCPTIVYSDKAIDRLLAWYPPTPIIESNSDASEHADADLKWIIGMRHPMHQVQSYYNYLVTEVYDKGYWLYKGIHSLDSIISVNEDNKDGSSTTTTWSWKDMASDTHRYEIHLERLFSKLLERQKEHLQRTDRNNHKKDGAAADDAAAPVVLLYTLEQLEVTGGGDSATTSLPHDLSTFVGLPEGSDLALGHENRNHFTGQRAHAETIDLCSNDDDEKHPWAAALRAKLLRDSIQTAQWMEDHVLAPDSPYAALVQVGGGHDDFVAQVRLWKQDICSPPS